MRAVTVRYGGLVANNDVSVTVPPGSVVGLIGPNGAGKSTFVDALSGFTPYSGTVELDGTNLDEMPAHERSRAGLARTWQSIEAFDDLSVSDNLKVGRKPTRFSGMALDALRPGHAGRSEAAERAMDMFGLTAHAGLLPSELSLGQRKLLGMARAIASNPRAVLLDEPAAGLDAPERERLGGHIVRLASEGLAVLLIDHDVSLVLGLCESISVLDFGRVIATGTAEEIRKDEAVLDAYLGTG